MLWWFERLELMLTACNRRAFMGLAAGTALSGVAILTSGRAEASFEVQRTLADWGHEVGASERTLSRLFAEQTGLSFARWRTNARIGTSIALLAAGTSVNAAARAVGYDTPTSFARAFRDAVGQPPRTFVTTNLAMARPA